MNESLGGLVNIVIISVFIVIAMGYIAFNVNYTKAFRMKDKIITVYDKYDGNCDINSPCSDEIKEYAREIGYSAKDFFSDNNFEGKKFSGDDEIYSSSEYEKIDNLYVRKKVYNKKCNGKADGVYSYDYEEYHYNIVTKVNLSLPIIDKFMGFDFLYVDGNTNLIKGYNCSVNNGLTN